MQYLCLFPQYVLGYLDPAVRLFVAQSMADAAQQGFVMELGCNPIAARQSAGACNSSQFAYLNSFRQSMITALQPVLNDSRSGAFLAECSIHVIEDDDGSWTRFIVEGQSQRDTLRAWYTSDRSMKSVVVDGPWGSNPTCGYYSQWPSF
jgi:hypothetical protein